MSIACGELFETWEERAAWEHRNCFDCDHKERCPAGGVLRLEKPMRRDLRTDQAEAIMGIDDGQLLPSRCPGHSDWLDLWWRERILRGDTPLEVAWVLLEGASSSGKYFMAREDPEFCELYPINEEE